MAKKTKAAPASETRAARTNMRLPADLMAALEARAREERRATGEAVTYRTVGERLLRAALGLQVST